VTPYTPKEITDSFKSYEASINNLRSLVNSAPKDIAPIDWAHWQKVIKTPGFVSELKKEFDAAEAKPAGGAPVDFDAVRRQADADIKDAEEIAAKVGPLLESAKIDLARAESMKAELPFRSLHAYYKYFPGLEEQLRDELNQSIWDVRPEMMKIANLDFVEMRKQLNAGKDQEIVGLEWEHGCLTIGDYNYLEEMDKLEALGLGSVRTKVPQPVHEEHHDDGEFSDEDGGH
jgi:hypothetical protein